MGSLENLRLPLSTVFFAIGELGNILDRWFPHVFQVIPMLKSALMFVDVKKASNMACLGFSKALDLHPKYY